MAWALALDPSSCSGVIIIGIGIYTLTILCENLLCSTGNSPQCSVLNWMERNSKKEGIYVYVQLIHCHTVETNTILHSNYTTIKTYFEKKKAVLFQRGCWEHSTVSTWEHLPPARLSVHVSFMVPEVHWRVFRQLVLVSLPCTHKCLITLHS